MIVKHEMYGETYKLSLQFAKYANGQTAIKLFDMADGFPFATATVCVEDNLLKEDEVAIKDYSENAGMLDSLIEAKIVEHPHAFIQSGHVKIPICKLKDVNNF
jgi:hypothetical protein